MSRHQFPKFSEEYSAHWRAEGLWSDITLHDGFDTTVARSPNSVAIITDDSRYSFREFKQEADALAAGLIGIGQKSIIDGKIKHVVATPKNKFRVFLV